MKIWAFPSIYPFEKHPQLRSAGIFAHRQYKGLIKNGADLEVIIPVPWSPPAPFSRLHSQWKHYADLEYPRKRTEDGIVVYHPRIYNMKPNRFIKKSFVELNIDAIVNFFKRNKIALDPAKDIFYSQWIPNSSVIQEAAHRLGIKSAILGIGDDIIIYPHEKKDSFDTFKKTWIEADNRFVVADYLGKEANKIIGMSMPYDVIFMGVEHNFFKPMSHKDVVQTKKKYNIPTDKTIILTIGSAIKRKGWLDLFDAEKEIKKVNDEFFQVAIHAGASEFNLNEEAEKRGLSGNFLNLGEISPGLLNKLLGAADIFCLPSHWEGMANVIMESMSSGLAVITTDVCGHPEIIKNGATGILVPAAQPKILAKELLSLLNDPKKRIFLGTNARDFIVDEWGDFTYASKPLYSKLSAILSAAK